MRLPFPRWLWRQEQARTWKFGLGVRVCFFESPRSRIWDRRCDNATTCDDDVIMYCSSLPCNRHLHLMRTLSLNDADLHQTHAHVAKNPRLTLLADQTDDGSRIFFFLRFAYLEGRDSRRSVFWPSSLTLRYKRKHPSVSPPSRSMPFGQPRLFWLLQRETDPSLLSLRP